MEIVKTEMVNNGGLNITTFEKKRGLHSSVTDYDHRADKLIDYASRGICFLPGVIMGVVRKEAPETVKVEIGTEMELGDAEMERLREFVTNPEAVWSFCIFGEKMIEMCRKKPGVIVDLLDQYLKKKGEGVGGDMSNIAVVMKIMGMNEEADRLNDLQLREMMKKIGMTEEVDRLMDLVPMQLWLKILAEAAWEIGDKAAKTKSFEKTIKETLKKQDGSQKEYDGIVNKFSQTIGKQGNAKELVGHGGDIKKASRNLDNPDVNSEQRLEEMKKLAEKIAEAVKRGKESMDSQTQQLSNSLKAVELVGDIDRGCRALEGLGATFRGLFFNQMVAVRVFNTCVEGMVEIIRNAGSVLTGYSVVLARGELSSLTATVQGAVNNSKDTLEAGIKEEKKRLGGITDSQPRLTAGN